MFSTVLHLLVYSLTVVFCQWALTLTLTLTVGFNFNFNFYYGLETSSHWHQNCGCLETIHFPSGVAHSHVDFHPGDRTASTRMQASQCQALNPA